MNPLAKPTIVNSSIVFDNSNILDKVVSYLGNEELTTLFAINTSVSKKSDEVFKDRYQKMFGEINNQVSNPDKQIMEQLLIWGEKQPDITINHNIYKAPKNWFEKLKWLIEVENHVDIKIQKIYSTYINLFSNTQPNSILQIHHLMNAFWHLDRQINDYKKYKSDEKSKFTNNLIKKITFVFLWIIIKLIYKSSSIKIEKTSTSKSRIRAKIGDFQLNGKNYDVVALFGNPFETTLEFERTLESSNWRGRIPLYDGKICIGILKKDKDVLSQNFVVKLDKVILGIPPDNNSYLNIHALKYLDYTRVANGSDRKLDQKLTQIMIEMLMQNHAISLKTTSIHGIHSLLLTAGGFKTCDRPHTQEEEVIQQLHNFRSQEGNKLFPPFSVFIEYGYSSMEFRAEDMTNKNVHFSRDGTESWADIIKKNPILKPNSAILAK